MEPGREMVRRRNVVTIVAIAVIVAVLATVAVTYALPTILGTKEVSATVTIVPSGENLAVCSDSDADCDTSFTGDLNFGTLLPGSSNNVFFRIKNTASTSDSPNTLFVDARIRFNNVIIDLSISNVSVGTSTINALTGDVPNLGNFVLVERLASGALKEADSNIQPGEVRIVEVEFTADPNLTPQIPQALNFHILLDAVDSVE